jgi:hypothetical protein
METARIRTGQCKAHITFVFAMHKSASRTDKEVSKVFTMLSHSEGLSPVSVKMCSSELSAHANTITGFRTSGL